MFDPDYEEIYEEAVRRMREWTRHYMCQDINHRHGLDYWVFEVTKEKFNGTN